MRIICDVVIAVLAAALVLSACSAARDHLARGNEFFAAGDYAAAIINYDRVIELRPDMA